MGSTVARMDRSRTPSLSEERRAAASVVSNSLIRMSRRAVAEASLNDKEKADRSERFETYKLLVEMADRVSQRRQAANSFYLSINTLLVSGSAYLGTTNPDKKTIFLISLAGILVCIYWNRSIGSYKTLNTAKFEVINEIEERLVEQPFANEWKLLDPDGDGKRHKPFHKTEKLVPYVFIAMYVFQLVSMISWNSLVLYVVENYGGCP